MVSLPLQNNYKLSKMIQRIQTVFLFVVVVALVAFNFYPYWENVRQPGEAVYQLYSYAQIVVDGEEITMNYGLFSVVCGFTALAVILALFELVMYKNRLTQMKIGALNSVVMTVALGFMTYFVLELQKELSGSFGAGIFILALAMLANVMARRFINKDEKLVRSVDRLR
jgi:type IV secretory pathway TrbD component